MQQKPQQQEIGMKDASKRIYTSLNQNMPRMLSYQNIKLANFLELELTDLWDSLLQVNENNFKNQLKQTLSRSYNAFHEMKKLFDDLDMEFLYEQTKKLISCYGVIFVQMLDKIQKLQKSNPNIQSIKQSQQQKKLSNLQKQINDNIKILKERTSNEVTRKQKRQKGIHLYNQSYARCIDYNIEYFREIRNKEKQKNKTDEEKILTKMQQDRKFKKQVIEEINDLGSLQVDGEELHLFLNRHKGINETGSKICLGDELEKIAIFFKESQHQALEFLRKEKNLESFHELTQGFNLIVADYENCKANQIFFVQDKIKQIFQYIKKKVESLQRELAQKENVIKILMQKSLKKKRQGIDSQTQTFMNIQQQFRHLRRRILTAQTINQQLKAYIAKANDEDRKQKMNMLQKINYTESSYKQTKQTLEEKIKYIVKIEKRLKILENGSKSKNLFEPIELFVQLSEEKKAKFIQDLKDRGFITTSKKNSRYSTAKNTRLSSLDKRQSFTTENENISENGNFADGSSEKSPNVQQKKRQSSFFKKAMSNHYLKDLQTKNIITNDQNPNKNIVKQNDLTVIEQQNSGSSNYPSENEKDRIISSRDKQTRLNSKKVITIRPMGSEKEQKSKVFDIKQANGLQYSQKSLKSDSIKVMNSNQNVGKTSSDQQKRNNEMNQISEDCQDSAQEHSKLSRKKRLNAFQTAQMTQQSVEDASDHINQSQIANQANNSTIKSKKNSSKKHKKDKNNGKQQVLGSQGKKYRNAAPRTSCQQALQKINQENVNVNKFQNLQRKIQEKWELEIINKRKQQLYKRCSIVNQVSISIDSKSNVESFYSNNSKARSYINLIKNGIQKKDNTTEDSFVGRQNREKRYNTKETEPEGQFSKMRQNLKTTTRKLNHNRSTNEIAIKENKIITDHQKTRLNLRNNSIAATKSLSNTFHKEIKQKVQKAQQNTVFFQNTASNFKTSNEKIMKGINSDTRSKNLFNQNQNQSSQIKSLEQQLGEEEIVEASRNCSTSEEFQMRVLKIHQSKCGKNCKHLQRFLDIFQKIRKENYKYRKQIKLHIENLNEKLMMEEIVNLPSIGKKV